MKPHKAAWITAALCLVVLALGIGISAFYDDPPYSTKSNIEYENKTKKDVWVKYVDAAHSCNGKDSIQMSAWVFVPVHSGISLQPNAFDRPVKACITGKHP